MNKILALGLISFSGTAFADVDCSNVNLVGSWDSGRTVISQDRTTSKLTGVDTSQLNDFAGMVIQRSYYDISFDIRSCVISQLITKTGMAKASDPTNEDIEIVKEELEPGAFRTFSVRSFYKVLDFSMSANAKSLTLIACKDATCNASELEKVFTITSKP